MHDQRRAHLAGEVIQQADALRVAGRRFVRDQDVGSQDRQRVHIFRPDRRRGQKMRERRGLPGGQVGPADREVGGELLAPMQSGRGIGRPDMGQERTA